MDETKIKKVLYIIVMEQESKDIIGKCKFELDESFTNKHKNILQAYTSTYISGLTVHLLWPIYDPLHQIGVFGTEIAFLLTYLGVQHYAPDLVISFGYAGSNGLFPTKLGDVCIADKTGIYHRNQMLIEPFKPFSTGNYPLICSKKMANDLGYLHAQVGSSNDYVLHDEIALKQNIGVLEMELGSVARACYYFKTACTAVKIISDGGKIQTKEEREKEFLDSLELLRDKLVEAFNTVNSYLAGISIRCVKELV